MSRRTHAQIAADARAPYAKALQKTCEQRDALRHTLRKLVESLEWERKRSGTTYAGFDEARELLAKLEGSFFGGSI